MGILQPHERHVFESVPGRWRSLSDPLPQRATRSFRLANDGYVSKDDDSRTAEGDYGYPLRGLAYAASRKMLAYRTPFGYQLEDSNKSHPHHHIPSGKQKVPRRKRPRLLLQGRSHR